MRSIVSVLFGFFSIGNALAATIHVPGDYPTIYEALDAAVSGDVVEVAPGTYDQFDTRPAWDGDNVSAIGFLKSGVLLRSSGGAANTTLRLDDTVGHPVVLFGVDPNCEVEGFTLTGSVLGMIALAFPPSKPPEGSLRISGCVFRDFGGENTETNEYAIDGRSSTLEILDCLFEDIDSPGFPVVALFGVDCLVEDCAFTHCSGGGIRTLGGPFFEARFEARRSQFLNLGNLATGSSGLWCENVLDAIVEECSFLGNLCSDATGSPAFQASASTAILRLSTFAHNNSGGTPEYDARLTADAVETTGNTFYGGSSPGGALQFSSFESCTFTNNVFSHHSGNPAVRVFLGSPVQSACNVFWENAGGHILGFSLGPTDLVADPQYCDAPALDFTVNAASPCLPWNNNGCGQIGAWGLGCGDVSVEPTSWGQIKALYR